MDESGFRAIDMASQTDFSFRPFGDADELNFTKQLYLTLSRHGRWGPSNRMAFV